MDEHARKSIYYMHAGQPAPSDPAYTAMDRWLAEHSEHSDDGTGGYLVPDSVVADLARIPADAYCGVVFRYGEPFPTTRRRRFVTRIREARWRLSTAVDVLRGRHDCDDY